MFSLSSSPLNTVELKRSLASAQAGALSIFEGWVRNHNSGKTVVGLEYEAFPGLCTTEAQNIFAEAKSKFSILEAKCVHRVGRLNVGDLAVWVGVTAAHRAEAFGACRYIIDEIKHRLPIWKKEFYTHGETEWVNCGESCLSCASGEGQKGAASVPTSAAPISSPQKQLREEDFYARQQILPMVGVAGQKKLKKAKVLVVGAGGLGTPALQYLAAAGIGTIGICEFDQLDVTNLHRQILYRHDQVGQPKIQLAEDRLRALNPFITIRQHPYQLTVTNVQKMISEYDLVLDGSDNFLAKYLLNDACVLAKVPLIIGSVFHLEGQLRFLKPAEKFSCLRCLWPDIPSQSCVGSCVENGIIGVVPGVVGTSQALEAIKFFLGLPTISSQSMIIYDFLQQTNRALTIPKDPACPLCATKPRIKKISAEHYVEVPAPVTSVDIELKILPWDEFNQYQLVDVREVTETKNNPVSYPKLKYWPTSQLKQKMKQFPPTGKYLLYCGKGFRSHRMAETLRQQGFKDVLSIIGGAPEVRKYLKERK